MLTTRKGGGAPRHDKNSGLVQYKDGLWGIDLFLHGQRHRQKVGKLTEARKLRDDLKAAERRGEVGLAPKPTQRKTLGDWLDIYLSTPRGPADLAFATKWKEALQTCYPEHFTLDQLRTWCHDRLAAGSAIASVWRQFSPLRATYSIAQRSGEITLAQNPFRDIRALSLPPINNQRDNYLHMPDQATVAECLGPTWWPYAEFAILTMMRLGNQRALRWDNIDWGARIATLEKTKTGKKFHVRLSEVALELLEQQLERQQLAGVECPWCWPNSHGGQLDPAHFRLRVWGPAFERAGLKQMQSGQGRNGLTWHDLRHTGPTRLAQAGADLYTIKDLTGHGDIRTTQRYAHHCEDRARVATERLAAITRSTPKTRKNEAPNEALRAPDVSWPSIRITLEPSEKNHADQKAIQQIVDNNSALLEPNSRTIRKVAKPIQETALPKTRGSNAAVTLQT